MDIRVRYVKVSNFFNLLGVLRQNGKMRLAR